MSKLLKMSATAATVAAFMSAQAHAADLYAPPSVEPMPPPEPAWSWTGPYAGLHLGYGWSDVKTLLAWEHLDGSEVVATTESEFFPYKGGGVAGGALTGANMQWGRLVLGIEGDFSLADSKVTTRFESISGEDAQGNIFAIAGARQAFTTEIDWLATLRGRIGLAWDRFLFFGTGGVAFARIESTYFNEFMGRSGDTRTEIGYVVGGGAEAWITKDASLRLEYLYVDLAEGDYDVTTPLDDNNSNYLIRTKVDMHILRAALSYHF